MTLTYRPAPSPVALDRFPGPTPERPATSEDVLWRAYHGLPDSAVSRTRPCACGEPVTLAPGEDIDRVMGRHVASPMHRQWRSRHAIDLPPRPTALTPSRDMSAVRSGASAAEEAR